MTDDHQDVEYQVVETLNVDKTLRVIDTQAIAYCRLRTRRSFAAIQHYLITACRNFDRYDLIALTTLVTHGRTYGKDAPTLVLNKEELDDILDYAHEHYAPQLRLLFLNNHFTQTTP